jgi:hypothetical protein
VAVLLRMYQRMKLEPAYETGVAPLGAISTIP